VKPFSSRSRRLRIASIVFGSFRCAMDGCEPRLCLSAPASTGPPGNPAGRSTPLWRWAPWVLRPRLPTGLPLSRAPARSRGIALAMTTLEGNGPNPPIRTSHPFGRARRSPPQERAAKRKRERAIGCSCYSNPSHRARLHAYRTFHPAFPGGDRGTRSRERPHPCLCARPPAVNGERQRVTCDGSTGAQRGTDRP
jgi:hypothetical protein